MSVYTEQQVVSLAHAAKVALDQWYEAVSHGNNIELVVAGERLAGVLSRLQTLGELTTRKWRPIYNGNTDE